MLVDPIALAWSSWLGLAIGVLGLLVSIIGLSLTFREASRAKVAAELARAEVERAVALMRSRNRLATLASGVSQIDLMLERVARDALRSAPEALTALRRSLIEARLSMHVDDLIEVGRLGVALDDLTSVDKLIWSDVEDKAKKAQMATILQRVRDALMELEAAAKSEELA